MDGRLRSGHGQDQNVFAFGSACKVGHAVVQGNQRDALPGGEARVVGKLGQRIRPQPQDAAVVQFHFDARGAVRAQPGRFTKRQVAPRGLPVVRRLQLHLDAAFEVAHAGVARMPGIERDREQPQGQAFHESSRCPHILTRGASQAWMRVRKKDLQKTGRTADEVNMTNAINASNPYVQQASYQPPSTAHSAGNKASPGEDSVQLSSAAKAAMGDVDHDGDSH